MVFRLGECSDLRCLTLWLYRLCSVVPLLGQGMGLALHGIWVFVLGTGSGLQKRMVQKVCKRLQRERGES